ncbi:hypothetical protein ETB97_010491 [Aspergillus alliaceus]|uniref:Rhodopsin domain-containing protein n=1 Tax=Petromyces alliaceus TaxID=209559 RepID=A0A8H6E0B7_PETAA|nr:hypothetical protein ETB97_010491 [Aspergillus burnettii]
MGRFSRDTWKPTVNVVTWFLMTTAILCVLTRLGTKYWIFRRWTTDDYLSIVSMVLCAAQSLAMSMATANGYGEHYDRLSRESMDGIMKSQYAATILFITTMCVSKLALVHFIWSITPATSDRRVAIVLEIFTVLWGVTGVFGHAFQCKPPRSWDYIDGNCFDIGAWGNYLAITNMLTEAGIIVQALLIIVGIQARWAKKVTLSSIFGLRIFLRSTGMRIDGMTSYNMASMKRYEISTMRHKSTFNGSEVHELAPINLGKETHVTTVTASGAISDGDTESQSSQTHIIREIRTFTVTETNAAR